MIQQPLGWESQIETTQKKMEPNDNDLDFECIKCGKPIPSGKPYVCIEKNIEHIEHNIISNSHDVEVLNSQVLATFCGSCGNAFDSEMFVMLIKTLPLWGREGAN